MIEQFLASHVYLLGIFLGLLHSFEADHIAAVSAMVSQTKSTRTAAALGAWWGLGHAASLLVVSFVVLGLHLTVPETVAVVLEGIVGVVLVTLGVYAFRATWKEVAHEFAHIYGRPHTHDHSTRMSFIVGCFHGLAGSSALILIALPLTYTLKEGIRFVLSFGLGSVISMAIFAASVGFIMRHLQGFAWASRYAKFGVSILCIGIGAFFTWSAIMSIV